jgi:hypothetical protein
MAMVVIGIILATTVIVVGIMMIEGVDITGALSVVAIAAGVKPLVFS